MRMVAPLLLLPLALVGCTSDVMLGQACSEPGCELRQAPQPKMYPDLPEPEEGCAVQLETSPHTVLPQGVLDRCQLFTLDAFSAPQGGVFLTQAELLMTPYSHHVEVYIAPESPFPDGEVPCDAVGSEASGWFPLLVAQGEWDYWDYRSAPFPITSRHRVLINHHYANNRLIEASRVSVLLNLHCIDHDVPERVGEAFSFEARGPDAVPAGSSLEVAGEARFGRPVRITTLFRRTHMIEHFGVEKLDNAGGASGVWAVRTMDAWRHRPDPPLSLSADEALRFTCTYENPEFAPLPIGGPAADACTLLGVIEHPRDP